MSFVRCPLPTPYDEYNLPRGANYNSVEYTYHEGYCWNSIRAVHHGKSTLTIFATGNIDLDGVQKNRVIYTEFPLSTFSLSATFYPYLLHASHR